MKYKVEMIVSKEHIYDMNRALEFYLRMGICQFSSLDVHSGLEKLLMEKHRPDKEIEVGDSTTRGKVIDMDGDKCLVKGRFIGGIKEEWTEKSDLVLSIDYGSYHKELENINKYLSNIFESHPKGSFGIHNNKVSEDSKICADIHMVLRNKITMLDYPDENDYFSISSFAPQFSISNQDLPKIKIEKA